MRFLVYEIYDKSGNLIETVADFNVMCEYRNNGYTIKTVLKEKLSR